MVFVTLIDIDIHHEGGDYYSYHYPGFDTASGFPYDEKDVIKVMKDKALITGKTHPTVPIIPPVVLNTSVLSSDVLSLRWRGTPGAQTYSVSISFDNQAYTVVDASVQDNKPSGSILYNYNIPADKKGVPIFVQVTTLQQKSNSVRFPV